MGSTSNGTSSPYKEQGGGWGHGFNSHEVCNLAIPNKEKVTHAN